jgi:uncharacterized protein YjbI with pentapeptide repeats
MLRYIFLSIFALLLLTACGGNDLSQFEQSDFSECVECDLSGAILYDADLHRAYLGGADPTLALIPQFPDPDGATIVFWAGLTGANLHGSDLTGADMRFAQLTDADLTRADLTDSLLTDANLTDAILTDAILTDSNLRFAILNGADLTGASLAGADLYGADLYGADLSGADLRAAHLGGASLYGADLSDANLDGVTCGMSPGGVLCSGADFDSALNVPAKYLKD